MIRLSGPARFTLVVLLMIAFVAAHGYGLSARSAVKADPDQVAAKLKELAVQVNQLSEQISELRKNNSRS